MTPAELKQAGQMESLWATTPDIWADFVAILAAAPNRGALMTFASAERASQVTCALMDCSITAGLVRGLCDTHYARARRLGELALLPVLSAAERLTAKLARMPNGCLEWTGGCSRQGYGIIGVAGKKVQTHRLAWELANGPIPEGMCILHHCDNPPCCDAEKCLFLGTKADNMADMAAKGRDHNQKKTHCPAGHLYDLANTRISARGGRICRSCHRVNVARYDAKRRAVA